MTVNHGIDATFRAVHLKGALPEVSRARPQAFKDALSGRRDRRVCSARSKAWTSMWPSSGRARVTQTRVQAS